MESFELNRYVDAAASGNCVRSKLGTTAVS